jgi:hypothetical protein
MLVGVIVVITATDISTITIATIVTKGSVRWLSW